jgi:hypothetical protein
MRSSHLHVKPTKPMCCYLFQTPWLFERTGSAPLLNECVNRSPLFCTVYIYFGGAPVTRGENEGKTDKTCMRHTVLYGGCHATVPHCLPLRKHATETLQRPACGLSCRPVVPIGIAYKLKLRLTQERCTSACSAFQHNCCQGQLARICRGVQHHVVTA